MINKNEVFRLFMLLSNGAVCLEKIQRGIGNIYEFLRVLESKEKLVGRDQYGNWHLLSIPKLIFDFQIKSVITEEEDIISHVSKMGYTSLTVKSILRSMVRIELLKQDQSEYWINRQDVKIQKGNGLISFEIEKDIFLLLHNGSLSVSIMREKLQNWGSTADSVLWSLVCSGALIKNHGFFYLPNKENKMRTIKRKAGIISKKILEFLENGENDTESMISVIGVVRSCIQKYLTKLMESGKISRRRVGKKYMYLINRTPAKKTTPMVKHETTTEIEEITNRIAGIFNEFYSPKLKNLEEENKRLKDRDSNNSRILKALIQGIQDNLQKVSNDFGI